jgi:hypothetical protein
MVLNRPISIFKKFIFLGFLNIVMITIFWQRYNLTTDNTLLLKNDL